ncbi:MAG: hypothetical protein NVSMB14_09180 [Isosphaeraceae bacterium]
MPDILNAPPSALCDEVVDVVRKAAKLRHDVVIEHDSRLVEDLGIDSLDLVGVFLEIQDHFDVLIDDEDLLKLARVRDIVQYVRSRSSATAA